MEPVVLSLLAGFLTTANLVALFFNILLVLARYDRNVTTDYVLPQEIWFPFTVGALAQALVTGVILAAWKRTRPAGLGVLLGTALAGVLFVGWLVALLAALGG